MVQLLIIVAVALVLVVAAFAGAAVYRVVRARRMRRAIVQLIGRKEAIVAGCTALRRLVAHLAECPDDELVRFATQPECEDRRAFGDVGMRMRIVGDEIALTDVPRQLEEIVLDMEDTARKIGRAAEIADASRGGDALTDVARLDLRGITEQTTMMDRRLHEIAVAHGVDDSSVYGGGLYI